MAWHRLHGGKDEWLDNTQGVAISPITRRPDVVSGRIVRHIPEDALPVTEELPGPVGIPRNPDYYQFSRTDMIPLVETQILSYPRPLAYYKPMPGAKCEGATLYTIAEDINKVHGGYREVKARLDNGNGVIWRGSSQSAGLPFPIYFEEVAALYAACLYDRLGPVEYERFMAGAALPASEQKEGP